MGDPQNGWFGKSNETILGNTISLIPVCLKMGVCRDTHKFQQTSVSLFPPCLDMIKIHSVPRVPQFLQFIADVLVPQLPCKLWSGTHGITIYQPNQTKTFSQTVISSKESRCWTVGPVNCKNCSIVHDNNFFWAPEPAVTNRARPSHHIYILYQ